MPASDKLSPPDLERYSRWGPLRVRPGLRISDVGRDDNIFLDTREPVSDYRATVSPLVEGLVLFGDRAFLTFRERLDFTSYLDNRSQNYVDQRGAARLTVPLRRFGLFATANLDRIQSRPVDREDRRLERRLGGFGLGGLVAIGWRTDVEVEGWQRRLSHRDADAEDFESARRLDRDESGVGVEARYLALGRTRLTLRYDTRHVDFDRLLDVGDAALDRDSRQWSLMPGVDLGDRGRLRGTLRAGWSRIDVEDPAIGDLREVVADADLVYRPNPRWNLRLQAERQPGFAIYESNTYYLDENAGLRAVLYVHRLFGVEAGASLGRLTFPEARDASGREDRVSRYDVGVRLRMFENDLGRRVEYSLRLGRYRRDSNLDAFDLSRSVVGLSAVVGF